MRWERCDISQLHRSALYGYVRKCCDNIGLMPVHAQPVGLISWHVAKMAIYYAFFYEPQFAKLSTTWPAYWIRLVVYCTRIPHRPIDAQLPLGDDHSLTKINTIEPKFVDNNLFTILPPRASCDKTIRFIQLSDTVPSTNSPIANI